MVFQLRYRIFTEKEEKLLRKWLKENVKLNGFSVLLHRIRKAKDKLKSDYELLEEVLKRIEEASES